MCRAARLWRDYTLIWHDSCYCAITKTCYASRVNYRFHIQNKPRKHGEFEFKLMIALDFGQRGGVTRPDFIFYTDSAWQLLFPIETSFQYEPQAQYALADVRNFLKERLARK